MTQIKRKYPPVSELERCEPRLRTRLIFRWHALQTEKMRWFVRPQHMSDKAYYCGGERPTPEWHEVFDCDWTPAEWATKPYKYVYNPIQDATYAYYARYGLPSLADYGYGWAREDSLILKNGEPHYYGMFRDNDVSAHYYVESGDIWITYNGSHTHYYGESDRHTQGGTFSTVADVKKPSIEPVMKAAKALSKAKYKGVYAPFIDRLVELYGLNRTQI